MKFWNIDLNIVTNYEKGKTFDSVFMQQLKRMHYFACVCCGGGGCVCACVRVCVCETFLHSSTSHFGKY